MSLCELCHKELNVGTSTFEAPYHYTESGLSYVYLVNVPTYLCPECNVQVADIPHMNELHQLISKDALLTPSPMSGEQFRFLRKETRLRPKEFAERVGIDPKTVGNWERSDALNRQNDLGIRYFLAGELFRGDELQEVISGITELSEYDWEHEEEPLWDGQSQDYVNNLASMNTLLGLADNEWSIAA